MRKMGRPRALAREIEQAIFEEKQAGLKTEQIAVNYNVSASTILRIFRKKSEALGSDKLIQEV